MRNDYGDENGLICKETQSPSPNETFAVSKDMLDRSSVNKRKRKANNLKIWEPETHP